MPRKIIDDSKIIKEEWIKLILEVIDKYPDKEEGIGIVIDRIIQQDRDRIDLIVSGILSMISTDLTKDMILERVRRIVQNKDMPFHRVWKREGPKCNYKECYVGEYVRNKGICYLGDPMDDACRKFKSTGDWALEVVRRG